MSRAPSSPWLTFDRPPRPDDAILFCLPHAGGGAGLFRGWQAALNVEGLCVCRIQLPGREGRIHEPPIDRMAVLLERVAEAVAPWRTRPHAYFGHSMGGVIAAELTLRAQSLNEPTPQRLFIAGSRPPHAAAPLSLHDMTPDLFRRALALHGGTPAEVLECAELMELFEPILRADYAVLETWAPKPVRLITVPMTVFAGTRDDVVTHDVVSQWELYAGAGYRRVDLDAGHFFVKTHKQALFPTIRETFSAQFEGANA